MKYLIKTLLFTIFLIIGNQLIGQHLGSWVIATTNQPYSANNEYRTLYYWELQFQASGLINQVCASAQGSTAHFTRLNYATSSGYYSNQELACYVASDQYQVYFYNSVGELKQTEVLNLMDPTMQIVPKPGSYAPNDPEVFCAIYTSKGHEKATPGAMWVTEIENPEGNLEIIPHKFSYRHSKNTDFCLSAELNGDRYMYYLTDEEGLNRVSILEIINNDPLYVVVENLVPYDTDLLEDHFSAHEMEMKQFADQVQFAWTTLESSGNLYMVTYNFNTSSSNINVFNIGEGSIAGVEFSQMEDNIIYLSCANSGIVKYNYSIQQKNTLASSGEYKRTSLQTAPDGYIYAVNNNATFLGRIDQVNGVFENDIVDLTFQPGYSFEAYLLNQSVPGTLDYHMLPKHDVLSTMSETSDVSCPGMSDGTVTIYAGGGTPDYTITCLKDDVPITGFEYDENDHYFYKDGLSEGEYSYIITDARGISSEGTFIIGINDDYYDFKDTKFEVFNNRTLPDAEFPLNTYSFEEGILVHSGATLTITGSVYEFGKNAEIIIEPGATLELVGTTLTNHEECNLMWQGVEVQGDKTKSQQPELIDMQWVQYQGRLSMHNSAIENAIEAVGLLTRDANGNVLWDSGTGGIVGAFDSRFTNNTKSVHFMPYQNHMPGSVAEIGNASYFSNCTFELNENYIPDYTFYKHVDLDKVKGIEFKNCDFSLTNTNGVSPYNQGIAAYESEFSVLPNCQNAIEPCPEEDILHSNFSGFYRAVASYNADLTDRINFTVNQAVFTNNSVGVYALTTMGAIVTNSIFEIGENPVSKANYQVSESFGIDIYSSNGFILEDNEFMKFTGAEDGHYTGIRVFACPSFSDDIYRNKYTGLSVGNLAELYNRSEDLDDKTGVTYQCNQNYYNDYDFHVATNSAIRGNMGYPDMPSGNVLTYPSACTMQLQNDGTQDIRYYYNMRNPNEWLSKFSDYVYKFPIDIQNTCPTLHGSGGISTKLTTSQKLAKETEFAEKLADYTNIEILYSSLVDGGSTSAELSDIESATADEMWVLRNKLLGDSPHLSQEVLMAMSDRTDVFPDAVLLEILSANPEELRKEELISYLEDKENPLPEYMIDILMQVANGSTYKSVLQNQMAKYHHGYVNAAQDIIRSLQHDSITDFVQLRYWLDNIGGYEMDKQIISTYMDEDDYASAQSLLDILPSIYELEGDQLLAYNDYHTMVELQIQFAQQQRNIHQLTSSELATITSLADNGLGSAKYSARSILEYAYGMHYFDRPSLPENIGLKTVKPIDQDEWAKALGLELSVDPNPASTWAEFTWQLPPAETTGLISITDVTGKTISTISISGVQGKRVWDTREIKSGVYICTLSAGKLVASTKLIVK